MADDDFRFDEAQVRVINPCPKVDRTKLYKMANEVQEGLTGVRPPRREGEEFFKIEYRWGSASGEQWFTLQPGESRIIPKRHARTIANTQRIKGLVVVPLSASASDIRRACIEALDRAVNARKSNGVERLDRVLGQSGNALDSLRRILPEHYGYFINEAASQLLEEHAAKVAGMSDGAFAKSMATEPERPVDPKAKEPRAAAAG